MDGTFLNTSIVGRDENQEFIVLAQNHFGQSMPFVLKIDLPAC